VGGDAAFLAALADAERWGRQEDMDIDMAAGAVRVRRAVSMRSQLPPRKRARRSTTLTFTFTVVLVVLFVFVDVVIRGIDATSVVPRTLLVLICIREVALGLPSSREYSGIFWDEVTTRGCRVAMKSCADLKSVLADALRKRKGLKVEQRRTSLGAGCCCGCLASQKKRYR
jgi:hypothetical protein